MSSTGAQLNGDRTSSDTKSRKPVNPQVSRTLQEDHSNIHSLLPSSIASSGVSSGTSTPVPSDAPPSVQATSSARKHVRAEYKRRSFPRIDYTSRLSHFDPRSDYHDFRGFFVLFWIGLAVMVFTTIARNLRELGQPFSFRQRDTFMENIWEMGVSDLLMTSSTALVLPLNMLYKSGPTMMQWHKAGFWIQSIFQVVWLSFWITGPFVREWTWTAQVFFTLHVLVMFMKMHSYAFYNGHLADTLRKLNELDSPAAKVSERVAYVRYPSSRSLVEGEPAQEGATGKETKEAVIQLREALATELVSASGHVTYPQNLTVSNYIDYICCPTLCYELEYPRTETRSYMEIFYKTLAVFGCIFLLTVISDEFIIPVLDTSAKRLQQQTDWQDGALIFAETVSWLLFPFMLTFLLVFLVIFEYLCGAFAEITLFADRQFYSDWWNSLDWLEFSREWNIPVHHFFRRHVYTASRNTMSRPIATCITFFISALGHELIMGCITRKFRGYGFVAMMLQMPIVLVQRSPWVRKRSLLNNVLFWCSMISGLSMMCALYVLV